MSKVNSENKKLDTMRHSCAHVLAAAVKKLYPGVKFGIGPTVEDGFYYDFEFKKPISESDLPTIEDEMKKIVKSNLPFKKEKISAQKAKNIFKNQPYKLELIEELIAKNFPTQTAAAVRAGKNSKVSIYTVGKFIDLCRGPHVSSTGEIGPFKLLKVAGAYWRGDEKNKMLTRIYGTCFPTNKQLENYLFKLKEVKKRDHRKLGRELELFLIDEEFGLGLPLWLPKGAILRKQIMDFALKTYLKRGYKLVATPHIANLALWKRSGHWDFYQEFMYSPMKIDKEEYIVKPMNCPGHVKIYQSKIRSYKELPLRLTEMGTVYRYERGGVLHGLTRVRGFTQDDAHIFCTKDQLHQELVEMIDLTTYILSTFGFKEFEISLSVRDPKRKEKYLGEDRLWSLAEKALEKALKSKKLKFTRYEGEAVFYGPKIDFLVKDALLRKWQLTTIQVDFNFPERFNLFYIGPDGKQHQPIMLHRALLGSIERFAGILIEHYSGAFPLWLAPVQVKIIPISDRHQKYGAKILKRLLKEEVRAELDARAETMEAKIREATLQKIPFMIIIGEREIRNSQFAIRNLNKWFISVRTREGRDLGQTTLDKFLAEIKEKIEKKV